MDMLHTQAATTNATFGQGTAARGTRRTIPGLKLLDQVRQQHRIICIPCARKEVCMGKTGEVSKRKGGSRDQDAQVIAAFTWALRLCPIR